jgi:hypothetical protein
MKNPSSRFIVVCGASDVEESWLFGDFVGFRRVLDQLGATGEFLNVFPIREFFERGKGENVMFGTEDDRKNAMEIYNKDECENDIKFGTEDDRKSAMEIYTKDEWENEKNQPFFKQYKDDTLLYKDTLGFIDNATRTSEPGDSFTIVLIGHNNDNGISLGGGSNVEKAVLADLLAKFKPDVEVNLVIQSRSPGCFVDAIQAANQRPRSYLETSAKAGQASHSDILCASSRFGNSVLGSAFDDLLGFAYAKAAPGPDESNLKLISKFADVLSTDHATISFNCPHAARRILTPTSQDMQEILAQQGSRSPEAPFVPSEALSSTSQMLEAEISLVGGFLSDKDCGIVVIGTGARHARSLNRIDDKAYGQQLGLQLANFKWRFRIQEPFYLAFQALEENGLVSSVEECFEYPIAWRENSDTVFGLFKTLRKFRIARDSCSITSDMGLFEAPVTWLAVAIARTCPDVQKALQFLHDSQVLGPFDKEAFEDRGEIKVQVNRQEMACKVQKDIPQIGFWLPQNIKWRSNMGPWACNVRDRYRAMKSAYEKCYGEDSWGYDAIEPSLVEWIDS